MKWLRWEQGRQGGGYEKLMLISFLFFDCYLLRFSPGTEIKPHLDPVKGHRHHRLNITVRQADLGGTLCTYPDYPNTRIEVRHIGRVFYFRPDVKVHSMTKTSGSKTQYILSFGWLT